jgi:hypothetical protein
MMVVRVVSDGCGASVCGASASVGGASAGISGMLMVSGDDD